MSTLSINEPRFQQALDSCVSALRRVAAYQLEEPIQRRLMELSGKKEFLNDEEHDELMGLVDFWQNRRNDQMAAQVALKLLEEAVPELVSDQ